MANARRGEIAAELGGTTRRLVLTLGSLAELEAHFEAGDLVQLAERVGAGRLSAADLVAILGAGLRGAGETICDREVAALTVDGGAGAYARIAAALLAATFGGAPAGEGAAGRGEAVAASGRVAEGAPGRDGGPFGAAATAGLDPSPSPGTT